MNWRRSPAVPGAITCGLVAHAVAAGATDQWVLSGIVAVCAAASGLGAGLARRLPAGVALGWSALIAAHVWLGISLDLYASEWPYDKLVHGLAFVWITHTLAALPGARTTPRWLLGLAALGIGGAWELFEFATDHLALFVAQPGLRDTMWDLVCDAGGIVLGLALWSRRQRADAGV